MLKDNPITFKQVAVLTGLMLPVIVAMGMALMVVFGVRE